MSLLSRLLFGATTDDDIGLTSLEVALATLDPYTIPSVVAGRQLIADVVSSFPMVAIDQRTGQVLPGDRGRPNILRRPDPRRGETYKTTIERIVNTMTRHGMAWLHCPSSLRSSTTGLPLGLMFVGNARVNYQLNDHGNRFAQVTIDGRPVDLRDVYTIPFALDSDSGSPVGVSPLDTIAPALDTLRHAFAFATEYYGAGAAPPYVIKHQTRLDKTKRDEYLTEWESSRSRRRPALLTGAVELESFTPTNAAEAALWEAVRYFDSQVARVLQIPPDILNAASETTSTYGNVRDSFRRWLAVGLNTSYLDRIESHFAEVLPRGQGVQMLTGTLTRADLETRVKTAALGLSAGVYDQDEARQIASESQALRPIESTPAP